MTTPTAALAKLGQSLWLDNITRDLLDDGTLRRYVDEWSVTGLTSNPTIFEQAIAGSPDYDDQIAKLARAGKAAIDIYDAMSIDELNCGKCLRAAATIFTATAVTVRLPPAASTTLRYFLRRSSRLAPRTARAVPKCISSARLRAGPIPGTSSSGDAPIAFARFCRCAPIAKRCASSRRRWI